jgi:tRNA threonylcarbamoyladenosine biosynthesis protein TsaB
MKILAIDTATEACSVALLNDGNQDSIFEICPQQHSQRILPMIDELLSKHGLKVSDLDGLAYGRGPGSFTGVRIATGIIQGLALGADLRVVEVSTLAAMAQQNYMQAGHKISKVLIDARMQEVYFGHYSIENEDGDAIARELQPEAVLSPQEAIAKFAQISDDVKLVHNAETVGIAGTGWDAHRDILMAMSESQTVCVLYPSAEFMLPIAKKAFERCESISVDDISPIYLRDKVTWKKLPGKE